MKMKHFMALEQQEQEQVVAARQQQELQQPIFVHEIAPQKPKRICVQCDSPDTTTRKYVRKSDGRVSTYENWHDDGFGHPLCHTCFSSRWRKSKNKKMGRPRKILINATTPEMKQQIMQEQQRSETVTFFSLTELWHKMPPAFKHRDNEDLMARILDLLCEYNNKLSMRKLTVITGMNTETIKPRIATMFENALITMDANSEDGKIVIAPTEKGIQFLKVYRSLIELVAWIE